MNQSDIPAVLETLKHNNTPDEDIAAIETMYNESMRERLLLFQPHKEKNCPIVKGYRLKLQASQEYK